MNEWLPILAIYAAILTIAVAALLVSITAKQRRRKPYRVSKTPPASPVHRIRKGTGSTTTTRKTRARIGRGRHRRRSWNR